LSHVVFIGYGLYLCTDLAPCCKDFTITLCRDKGIRCGFDLKCVLVHCFNSIGEKLNTSILIDKVESVQQVMEKSANFQVVDAQEYAVICLNDTQLLFIILYVLLSDTIYGKQNHGDTVQYI
jgi:hypothetical protein